MRTAGCAKECKNCKRYDVPSHCKQFEKYICKRIKRFPYVCNGCKTRLKCRLQKYEYDPLYAERTYKRLLVQSRKGLNLTHDEFNLINKVLVEGHEKGQSINHIIASNPNLKISVKTAYNYVNSGNFQVKHEDLPNYENHILKKRISIPKEYEYQENKNISRKGREYYDYSLYIDANNISYHAEIDCVGITRDYAGALLTVIIPKWSFLLLYKLEIKDMQHVAKAIDFIYNSVGEAKFSKFFGVFLTDRGPEFNDFQSIEIDQNGILRTRLFYCDSGISTQKPYVERVNREIRRYVFKGQNVSTLTQDDCDLIASNIDSMILDSLGNRTPYEFAKNYLGKDVLDKLHIKEIKPKDLVVKNIDLIKYENKKSK